MRQAASEGYYEEVRESQIITEGSRSASATLMGVGPGLCGLPRTRLLGTWRQAFVEVRWNGLINPFQYFEVLRKRPSPKDNHLLAVGCYYIFAVGGSVR